MVSRTRQQLDQFDIARFCESHKIHKLSLFGSVLTDRFGPDSDVDVLVEFEPDARVSLFDVGGMMDELSLVLGRQVDIRTPNDLSRYFRDQVLKEAEVVYDRG